MLVEDHTDVTVEIKDEMAPVNSFEQLVEGKADMMNSYDGTLLTTFLNLDTPDIPEGTSLYDFVNEEAMERHGIKLLDKIGSENTYAIGVLGETADEYNLETISDLTQVSDQIVFGAEHDFYTEAGSMKYTPFIDFYDMNFKDNKPIDINLKYSAIETGNIDATTVYTTDGMNKKVGGSSIFAGTEVVFRPKKPSGTLRSRMALNVFSKIIFSIFCPASAKDP